MSDNGTGTPSKMRYVFGIFMICIYIGMGCLVLFDFFKWEWQWLRWTAGSLFLIYGFWRGYRQFKGMN